MGPPDRKRAFEDIARLRRAERISPNSGVARVRENLEEELGETISRNLAANLLGVSHTALNRWVASGDVPTVISERGRKEIPVPLLLDLFEQVAEERAKGQRKLHTLEPVMAAARARAERIRTASLTDGEDVGRDRHRTSELRSLAYHRAVAPRLRRQMVDEACRRVSRWSRDGTIDRRYAAAWEEVFDMPMTEIRKVISADDQRGRDLRQNSPLSGLLSEPERRKILETAR